MAKKKREEGTALVKFAGKECPLQKVVNVTAMILLDGKSVTVGVQNIEPLTDEARKMLGIKTSEKSEKDETEA